MGGLVDVHVEKYIIAATLSAFGHLDILETVFKVDGVVALHGDGISLGPFTVLGGDNVGLRFGEVALCSARGGDGRAGRKLEFGGKVCDVDVVFDYEGHSVVFDNWSAVKKVAGEGDGYYVTFGIQWLFLDTGSHRENHCECH